jgi:hypothetical protein
LQRRSRARSCSVLNFGDYISFYSNAHARQHHYIDHQRRCCCSAALSISDVTLQPLQTLRLLYLQQQHLGDVNDVWRKQAAAAAALQATAMTAQSSCCCDTAAAVM